MVVVSEITEGTSIVTHGGYTILLYAFLYIYVGENLCWGYANFSYILYIGIAIQVILNMLEQSVFLYQASSCTQMVPG